MPTFIFYHNKFGLSSAFFLFFKKIFHSFSNSPKNTVPSLSLPPLLATLFVSSPHDFDLIRHTAPDFSPFRSHIVERISIKNESFFENDIYKWNFSCYNI